MRQFTPSDLSTIAQSLDSLEQRVDQGRVGRESANMDDTGVYLVIYFFRYSYVIYEGQDSSLFKC
jgi:hypothetical protein